MPKFFSTRNRLVFRECHLQGIWRVVLTCDEAPFLCVAIPFINVYPGYLLGHDYHESKESTSSGLDKFVNKQFLYFFLYAVIATFALASNGGLDALPINICWFAAQLVIYAGLSELSKSVNDTDEDNRKEALNALSSLSLLMLCITAPLSLLSWSNFDYDISVIAIGLIKAAAWGLIFVLVSFTALDRNRVLTRI